ncbi:MAG: pirin family protein [Brevibacterium aurantiacum]
MSNVETRPDQVVCKAGGLPGPACDQQGRSPVEIITSREVPLGGPRAMIVRRTLPQRQRSLIGPWCFVDHYGPADVSVTGGMDVAPHPHTGLQTVSWLFEGAIQHIDSGGNAGLVLPGEVNLMTAGRGICHSEVSTEETTTLHGVQLWLALPEATRHQPEREFEHFEPAPVSFAGGEMLVFLGKLWGTESPVQTHSPLLGAGEEIVMWWNFIGRTHEEIARYREEWQAEGDRFGVVDGYVGKGGPGRNADGMGRLPAPRLPDVTIRARRNPPPQVQK